MMFLESILIFLEDIPHLDIIAQFVICYLTVQKFDILS